MTGSYCSVLFVLRLRLYRLLVWYKTHQSAFLTYISADQPVSFKSANNANKNCLGYLDQFCCCSLVSTFCWTVFHVVWGGPYWLRTEMGGSVVHQLARLPQELRSGSSGFNTQGEPVAGEFYIIKSQLNCCCCWWWFFFIFIDCKLWLYLVLVQNIWNVIFQDFCPGDGSRWGLTTTDLMNTRNYIQEHWSLRTLGAFSPTSSDTLTKAYVAPRPLRSALMNIFLTLYLGSDRKPAVKHSDIHQRTTERTKRFISKSTVVKKVQRCWKKWESSDRKNINPLWEFSQFLTVHLLAEVTRRPPPVCFRVTAELRYPFISTYIWQELWCGRRSYGFFKD